MGADTPRMQVALRATQLVFLARGEPPYRMALGSQSAQSAALPLHTLIPGYQPERLVSLGRAELAEPLVAAVESQVGAAQDWQRWGLWAVLLVGVGLLAAMAASVLRRPPDA